MAVTYSIYEAKAKLSELLRKVKKGHESIITERGKPIAKVIPFNQPQTFEERIRDMIHRGVIIPRKSKGPLPDGVSRPGGLARFLAERE